MRTLCLLVCCLTACGDDGVRHTPDAAPHDGASDAAADAAPEPVTLTATLGGVPQSGVHVYFLNADSSVVRATTTDANGTASAVMAAGGSVTALDPYGTSGAQREVYSFLGVKPGDNLVLDGTTVVPQITVTVTAPLDSAPGVQSYEVQSPCGGINLTSAGSGASPTGQLTLNGCGTKTDFVIVTRDAAFQIVDYIYAHDVAIADQGTVDLSAMTYAAGSTRTYQLTNVPPGFTPGGFTDGLAGKPNRYVMQSNEFAGDGSPSPITTVGFGTHVSEISISGAHVGQHYFLDWGPYTDTYTTDAGARLLPDLMDFPTLDPTTHEVHITEAAGGAPPDALYASIFVGRPSTDTGWYWSIAAPHGLATTLPTIPTDQWDPNIQPTDNYGVNQVVLLKVPGGYDAIRPYMLTNYGSVDFSATAAGQATTETLLAGFQRRRR
jgi:hypothetical protein